MLKLEDRILDKHHQDRSDLIGNAASVLARRVPEEAFGWLKRVGDTKDYLKLVRWLSVGAAASCDRGLSYSIIPLALQHDGTTSFALSNLTQQADHRAADYLAELLKSFEQRDWVDPPVKAAISVTAGFIDTYGCLFQSQRKYLQMWADRIDEVMCPDDNAFDNATDAETNLEGFSLMSGRTLRADMLSQLGAADSSLAAYDEAIQVTPHLAVAWAAKGSLLADRDEFVSALCCLNAAIELMPDRVKTWHNKGAVLAALGQYEEALGCFDEVLRLDPRQDMTVFERAKVAQKLGPDARDVRAQLVERFHSVQRQSERATNSEDPEVYEHLGRSHAQSGNYEEALKCFDRALEIDPNSVQAMYNKGRCLHALKRLKEAFEILRRASDEEARQRSHQAGT